MKLRNLEKLNGEKLMRSQGIHKDAVSVENRTVDFTFSSEAPVDRWFGVEILDHSTESIRTDRLKADAPLLLDHDGTKVIGVIEDFSINVKAKKASVTARFSRNPQADEVFQDIVDGIRKNVSVGYVVHDENPEAAKDEERDITTYRFKDWEPLEVSFVGVPADHTVGVGRAKKQKNARRQDMKKCLFCGKEHADINDRGFCPHCEAQRTTSTAAAADTVVVASTAAASAQRQGDLPSASVVDVQQITDDTRNAEVERIGEITALGDQFGMQEQAREAVSKKIPLDEFRKTTLAAVGKASKPGMITSDELGMNGREAEEYSFCRAILSMSGEKEYKNCFEREVHDTISKKYASERGGFMVPSDQVVPKSFAVERAIAMQRTTMIGSTDSLGGYLVGTEHRADMFLDFLRNRTVLGMMGSQIMEGLVGNIEWPTQTNDPTFYWLASEVAALTESNLVFGQNTMSPKPVTAKQSYSRQLLRQSNPSIENVVRNAFLNGFAAEVDRIGINGKTANDEPVGILNTSGIGAVAMGDDGGALTWGGVVDLESEVAIDNADMGALGYITNPKVRGAAKQTLKDAAVSGYVWDTLTPTTPLNGFNVGVTNNVPRNLVKGASAAVMSAMIYGNFNDALYGFWGAMEIEEDRITNADVGGGIVVRLFHFLDFLANRAESFAAIKDIDTN